MTTVCLEPQGSGGINDSEWSGGPHGRGNQCNESWTLWLDLAVLGWFFRPILGTSCIRPGHVVVGVGHEPDRPHWGSCGIVVLVVGGRRVSPNVWRCERLGAQWEAADAAVVLVAGSASLELAGWHWSNAPNQGGMSSGVAAWRWSASPDLGGMDPAF